MRVVVIGGTGHVGTYLIPRLVEAGYEVVNITRGQSKPYLPHAAWGQVQSVIVDREAEEAAGIFGQKVAALKPDIVIDMICFKLSSAQHIVEALRGAVQHFLHCGTIWVHGSLAQVPVTEAMPRKPLARYDFQERNLEAYGLSDYGAQKAAIEAYLLSEARRKGFPAAILHPGHIVGPGHRPVNPQGNNNPAVFERLARGEELVLPNFGLETVHHVHADDVAQAFMKAIQFWNASQGEAFHVVSSAALTLRGFAEAAASWFGQTAWLKFLPWEAFCQAVPQGDWVMTWDHIAHSPNASIAKAQRLLDYQPRYTSLEAVYEAVMWMVDHDVIRL
jgi:nucleoside-diphosphate-sugar epimerase